MIAPFAWCSLSGMEVAFAAALLVAMLLLLVQPATGPPRKLLVAVLAAASLSRPEAMLIVGGIVGVVSCSACASATGARPRGGSSPLLPPALWLIANKLFAGNFLPNTGVAKSHFYLPGFDWTYWWTAVTHADRAHVARRCSGTRQPARVAARHARAVVVGAVRVGAVGAAREAAARRCARDRRAVRDDARGDRVVGTVGLPELSLHRAGVPAAR